jgi:hypothetical protein
MTPRQEAEQMAHEWIRQLEQEYWEGSKCQCKELLINLLLSFNAKFRTFSGE